MVYVHGKSGEGGCSDIIEGEGVCSNDVGGGILERS